MSQSPGRWEAGCAVSRDAVGIGDRGSMRAPRARDRASCSLARCSDVCGTIRCGRPPRSISHDGLIAGEAGGDWVASDVATGLNTAIDQVNALDLDELELTGLQDLLRALNTPQRRLEAARTRVAGALHAREAAARGTGQRPAGQATERFLREQLGLTPSEARELGGNGRRLRDAPETADAFKHGAMGTKHASVITNTLQNVPGSRRGDVERELIGLAQRLDAVALSRAARRIVAREDMAKAEQLERRQHARRRFSYHDGPDGALRFSGELYGLEAEQARVAFDAFADVPDANERRTHDQRRADGFVAMTSVALRAGQAPTQHGVRPHVLILVPWERAELGDGSLRLASGESVTFSQARPWFDDCDFSRVVFGPRGTPIEVGTVTRTVPAGLWRALQVRDRGCTWAGCDAPIAWCDVAHGERPFADGGKLSPANAALLCRRHHRQFDRGGWRIVVDGARVSYHRDAPDELSSGLIGSRGGVAHGAVADLGTAGEQAPDAPRHRPRSPAARSRAGTPTTSGDPPRRTRDRPAVDP